MSQESIDEKGEIVAAPETVITKPDQVLPKAGENIPTQPSQAEQGDIMNIPLLFVYGIPAKKRADRSVSYVRDYVKRKYKVEKVIISQALNERLWARGARMHLRRIKVKAVYDAGTKRVKAGLPNEELKLE